MASPMKTTCPRLEPFHIDNWHSQSRPAPSLSSVSLSSKPTTDYSTKKEDSNCSDLEARKSNGDSIHTDTAAQNTKPSRFHWLKPSSRTTEDLVMGVSDGTTVPFALTASLVIYAPDARYIMLAGLAEIAAGGISMGLGGVLQAWSEAEAYKATKRATASMLRSPTNDASALIEDLYAGYDYPSSAIDVQIAAFRTSSLDSQLAFLMAFHHQMPPPDKRRAFKAAFTLSSGYILAGLCGLIPYMCVGRTEVMTALKWSVGIIAILMVAFGYVKTATNVGWRGRGNVVRALVGGLVVLCVGAVASGVAVGLIMGVDKAVHAD